MSDARKRAEEALATVAMRYPNGWGAYDTLSVCTDALRALLAEPAPPTDAPRVRLSACAWCGGSLVQDPDAPHRWRCINAEQRKCVARGDWYVLDDDRDYIPAYPAPATDAAPETPGTYKAEGHDEQTANAGQPEDKAERRDLGGDATARESAAVLGVQPADGALAPRHRRRAEGRMSAPYRYAIALTREQAGAVALACEAFARIGMGQLSEIGDHAPGATTVDGMMAIREALRAVEPLATGGLPPNASHGIASERVSITARRAWEVYVAVRECLARQHPEHCICVAHGPHPPIISGERPPRCEEIE